MSRATTIAVVTLLSSIGPTAAGAQLRPIDFDRATFTAQTIGGVTILTGSPGTDPGHPEGAGGRIGVLTGPDGVLLVDASYAPLAPKALASIRKLSSAPIRYLIDTHSHPDHTGGNPFFSRQGAVILAREETWRDLNQPPPPALLAAIGRAASYTDPARLPDLTYGPGVSLKIRMDGEIVDIIAAPPGHTGGDTIVRFEKADVMMIGDFYRNYGYPFVDAAHGGSFKGMLAAIALVQKHAGPGTRLVPGHGGIITSNDLIPYREMILSVGDRVRVMIADGHTLDEVLAAKLTAPYDAHVRGGLDPLPAGLGTSADRFVSALYAEIKRDGPLGGDSENPAG
jgi:glyoxylase-like metal-dependent hydrolase (beta-lactamase superfamily II)